MRNFGKEFCGTFDGKRGLHRTLDLGRTFSSLDKIALRARSVVLQNPSIIEKQGVPFGISEEP